MKHLDKYYFFLFNALGEPNTDYKYRYFFNSERRILVMKKAKNVNDKIINNWEELPKLTHIEKKNFLKAFAIKQKKSFKKEINKIINCFEKNSSFNLVDEFKKIDLGLALKFDLEKGIFLHHKIEKMYCDFDLNENMFLDFSDVQEGNDTQLPHE